MLCYVLGTFSETWTQVGLSLVKDIKDQITEKIFLFILFCSGFSWFYKYINRDWKMYMIESKGGAIACMLLALLFLGTWPAIMTLTERRGRLPQHTYLDYTLTNLLAAVIIAFTLGEIGPSRPNFITQLSQVSHITNSYFFLKILSKNICWNAGFYYRIIGNQWCLQWLEE